MRVSWEQYALNIAHTASQRSEDPYIKVGACALNQENMQQAYLEGSRVYFMEIKLIYFNQAVVKLKKLTLYQLGLITLV